MLTIYTDGACFPNPGYGGWGFVCFKNGNIIHTDNGGFEETTNNRMELYALIKALHYFKESKEPECIIYCDSQLVVNTYNSWMDNWFSKGNLKKKKNVDLIGELKHLKDTTPKMQLKWVKAHNGNYGNEIADKLSTRSIPSRIKQKYRFNGRYITKNY